jgi:hypothetical protein
MVTLYISELSYHPMTAITILTMLAILSALATLSLLGFTVINTVVTEGNTTGSISAAT